MLNAHKDMEHYGVTENVNGQMKMMGASESGLAQTWMIFLSGKERGRRRRRRRGKKEREKGERRRREEREEEGGFPSQDLCLTSACLRTSCKENLGPNIVSFLPTKQQLVASVSPRGGKSNE